MHYFWNLGPSLVSRLIAEMPEPKPPHSSISSIVRILEKKGFLAHNTYGKTHEYFPIIGKETYTKFSIKKLIRRYFEGSPAYLVSFLVSENELSLSDIEAIKEAINKEEQF